MKLFELHSEAGDTEDTLKFNLVPSEEFKGRLSPEWMSVLRDDCADSFIEIMNKAQETEPKMNNIGFLKIISRIDENGYMIMDNTALDLLEMAIDDMDEETYNAFNVITDQYSNKILTALNDYAEAVFSMATRCANQRR